MDEQAEKLAGDAVMEPIPRRNRGWFGSGDKRINREGRPRGSKAAVPEGTLPENCAPRADCLMRFSLPGRELVGRLTHPNGFWLVNLPSDAQIVDSRVDIVTERVVFVIRSKQFPRIARGTPIPEFKPEFNGLKWRTNWDWRP